MKQYAQFLQEAGKELKWHSKELGSAFLITLNPLKSRKHLTHAN